MPEAAGEEELLPERAVGAGQELQRHLPLRQEISREVDGAACAELGADHIAPIYAITRSNRRIGALCSGLVTHGALCCSLPLVIGGESGDHEGPFRDTPRRTGVYVGVGWCKLKAEPDRDMFQSGAGLF